MKCTSPQVCRRVKISHMYTNVFYRDIFQLHISVLLLYGLKFLFYFHIVPVDIMSPLHIYSIYMIQLSFLVNEFIVLIFLDRNAFFLIPSYVLVVGKFYLSSFFWIKWILNLGMWGIKTSDISDFEDTEEQNELGQRNLNVSPKMGQRTQDVSRQARGPDSDTGLECGVAHRVKETSNGDNQYPTILYRPKDSRMKSNHNSSGVISSITLSIHNLDGLDYFIYDSYAVRSVKAFSHRFEDGGQKQH